MSRPNLLLGAWIWMAVAVAPLVLYVVFVVGSRGGVGLPLTPGGLNQALTHWATGVGNNLANQIGGG